MPGFCVSLRQQFQLKSFGFTYDKPQRFWTSEWQWHQGVFVGWRVFWALWHIGWLARSIQDDVSIGDGPKWIIHATNWIYTLLTLQSVFHSAIVVGKACRTKASSDRLQGDGNLGWSEKTLWLLTELSFPSTVLVTVFYWGFVFQRLTKALNVVTHAVSSLYVLTDTFISATPVRILHFVYASSLTLVYVMFTVIYFLAGGTNVMGEPYIYKILDWSSPLPTLGFSAVFVFLAIPVFQLLRVLLYALRMLMRKRCGCGRKFETNRPEKGKP